MANARLIASAPSPATIIQLNTFSRPTSAPTVQYDDTTPISNHTNSTTSDHSIAPTPIIPNNLGDIIKLLSPAWTKDEYRKYYSQIEQLGVPSCLPREGVQAMVEGTAPGFHLNSETPLLRRLLLLYIENQYQWKIQYKESSNMLRDKTKKIDITTR